MVDLIAAHRHSSHHRAEIEASAVCGCFHCVQLFPPAEIIAWTGWEPGTAEEQETADAETALCPRCGSESVIGDKSGYRIDAQFLSHMHAAWYQKTVILKPGNKR